MATITRPTDTHKGRVACAKEHNTCFACRHYSAPYRRLSGFCGLGAPEWAYKNFNDVRWDNTCKRYEEA